MEAPTPRRRLTRACRDGTEWTRKTLHWKTECPLARDFKSLLARKNFANLLSQRKGWGVAKTTASAISSKYSCFKSFIGQFFLSCVCKLLRKRQSHNHSHQTALILHRYCTSQSYCHFCNRVPIFHHIFKRTSR